MLKVTIDVTPVDAKPSGVGLYVLSLIKAMSCLEDSESLQLGLAYQPRLKDWLKGNFDFPKNLKNYQKLYKITMPVRATNLFMDFLPKPLANYIENTLEDTDIFHGTNYTVYPCQKIQNIISIYDLSCIRYPEYVDSVVEQYTRRLTKCLRWTDAIITISESSKQDIVNYLNFPVEKVFVTSLASRYSPDFLNKLNLDQAVQDYNFDFSKPYLLFVSTIEPRKNIQSIIKAFNWLKHNHKIDHQLILIGKKGWKYVPIFEAIQASPWQNDIHHLNYLSDELVALFYSKADVFIYPSHYEGFGLPVLEAITLGAPVIASNTSSIPEVAGDAAVLINPNDFMELAEAILKVISDRQFRQDLINKGKTRANLFSWENTARKTLEAYRSIS
jgi:glycosyltransferase involved in cell wall biosynthesis